MTHRNVYFDGKIIVIVIPFWKYAKFGSRAYDCCVYCNDPTLSLIRCKVNLGEETCDSNTAIPSNNTSAAIYGYPPRNVFLLYAVAAVDYTAKLL